MDQEAKAELHRAFGQARKLVMLVTAILASLVVGAGCYMQAFPWGALGVALVGSAAVTLPLAMARNRLAGRRWMEFDVDEFLGYQ